MLQALAKAQVEGKTANLETLVDALRVRRADIRRTLSSLHREGYVDVLRMRLTLAGFAIGSSLIHEELPALRRTATSAIAAA